jgi:TetR/AcrR family transcriptional regulator, fatty acid biosynthesis regulator
LSVTPRARKVAEEPAGGNARAQRKLRTRENLMAAALRLIAQGRGFTSLGLREITREAGVVPASFYRHFKDMDELGLALVEETGLTLRRLLREARRTGVKPLHIIRQSVRIYRQYMKEHRLHIMFMASERWGGSPLIRRSIRYETQHFATELAQDLRDLKLLLDLPKDAMQMVCQLTVNTLLNAAAGTGADGKLRAAAAGHLSGRRRVAQQAARLKGANRLSQLPARVVYLYNIIII